MLLNLKALNESFENKYKLEEAFDESMPKWLKDRLAYSAVEGGESTIRSRKYKPHGWESGADKKYPEQPRSSFQQNRSTGEYGKELGLAPQFLKAGVDLSKVKVIEAPIPAKIPRITKNNQIIPIFLMENGQVWAKGINDREEYADYPYIPFKQMKNDDILSKCKAYCYIDLSDPNINTAGEKRLSRAQLRAELKKIPNYSRSTDTSWGNVDKSGYSNSVNIARYEKKAKELKLKNVDSLIVEYGQNIADYKTQISDILTDTDITAVGLLSEISRAIDDLSDASRYYNEACSAVLKLANIEPNRKSSYAEIIMDYLDRAKRELSRIEARLGEFMKVSADW